MKVVQGKNINSPKNEKKNSLTLLCYLIHQNISHFPFIVLKTNTLALVYSCLKNGDVLLILSCRN